MSILNLSFNKPMKHLVCCTDKGYVIYSLQPSIEKKKYNNKDGGVGIMKMYDTTNIGVLVGGGDKPFSSKDVLVLWDELEGKSIVKIDLREQIKNSIIEKDRIIVILEKKICVFNLEAKLVDVKKTYPNPNGLCVVGGGQKKSDDSDNEPIIVSLGCRMGQIAVWKLNNESVKTIDAHQSNIDCIAISHDGSMIATSSETGTLVRVFSTKTHLKLYEFRRGTTTAKIYDICFSWDNNYLACCSESGTVHIYQLNDDEETKNNKSMLVGMGGYLPEYFSSTWSYKKHSIQPGVKCICGFDKKSTLHIVTYDGRYYKIFGKDFEEIQADNLHYSSE